MVKHTQHHFTSALSVTFKKKHSCEYDSGSMNWEIIVQVNITMVTGTISREFI